MMIVDSRVETTSVPTEPGPQVPGSKLSEEVPGVLPGMNTVGLVAVGSLVFVFACFIVFSFLRSRAWCTHTWSRGHSDSPADIPGVPDEADVQVVYLADPQAVPAPSAKKSSALSKVDCKVFNIVGTTSEETSTDVGYVSGSAIASSHPTGGRDADATEFTTHIEVGLEMRARTVRFANIPDPVVRQASDPRMEVRNKPTSVKFQRSVSLEDAFSMKHSSTYQRLALPDGIRIYAHQNLAFDDSDDITMSESRDSISHVSGDSDSDEDEDVVVIGTSGQASET